MKSWKRARIDVAEKEKGPSRTGRSVERECRVVANGYTYTRASPGPEGPWWWRCVWWVRPIIGMDAT